MDPVTLVVTAVALGASAGLKTAAETAVKDAYAGLKQLLTRRRVDVSGVEGLPDSPTQRAALEETLTRAGAADDPDVLAAAQAVTEAVAAHDAATAQVIGVNLREVQAEFLRITKVRSTGTGVNVEHARFTGGIDIHDVHAGTTGTATTGVSPGQAATGREPGTRPR